MKNEEKYPWQSLPGDLKEALRSESEAELRELSGVWGLLGRSDSPFNIQSGNTAPAASVSDTVDASWHAVAVQLQLKSVPKGRSSLHEDRPLSSVGYFQLRLVKPYVYAAAAVLVFALLSFNWLVPTSVSVGPGQQHSVVLSDGSVIRLNSDSQVKYARPLRAMFSNNRQILLKGEAFFDVSKNERPFIVKTSNAQITVLGTQFNVRSRYRAADQQTAVAVLEGRVALANINGETVQLSAGEVATVNAQMIPATTDASPDQLSGWLEGNIALIDLPFSDLLSELERRFAIRIEVEPGIDLTTRKTAYYPADRSAESILSDLCTSEELAYQTTPNGFKIKQR